MSSEVMKVEYEAESCCVCGGGGELLSPEEHDAGAPPMQVPLRTMLVHLNSNKVVPDGRLCGSCIRRTLESYEFSTALSAKGVPPLSEKIRALRRRLHELTQKIDVFIVVGGAGADGAYSEDDVIMVERDTLASAQAADDDDLERARNARGDTVYQCSVCPLSFQRVSEYRAHAVQHGGWALHSCWTCGAQFPSRGALRAHAAAACAAPLACQLCAAPQGSPADLRRHEATCPPRCPACGIVESDRASLGAHVSAAHGRAGPAPYVCCVCFRVLDSPELLTAHLLRHRQAKHYVCGYDGCILRFATRNNLMSHIRKCHAQAVPEPEPEPVVEQEQTQPASTCDTCGRTFGSAAALKRHSRVHRSDKNQLPQEDTSSQEGEVEGDVEEMEGVEYLEVEQLEDIDYYHTPHTN